MKYDIQYCDKNKGNLKHLKKVNHYYLLRWKSRRKYIKIYKKYTRIFEEVRPIPVRHPTKVQGLIERYKAEKQLLALGETKFLIPDHMTVSDA
uniref:Uncharacterized protein n=1 Tax=Phocoena sinus TaxID=42100 RepID=A0A8C9BFN7_PHOSS